MHGVVVEVESLQLQGEQVGERHELQSLVGVAFRVAFLAEILIRTFQSFRLDESLQRFLLMKDIRQIEMPDRLAV